MHFLIKSNFRLFLLLFLMGTVAAPVSSRPLLPADAAGDSLKVGLVLSGGGAMGIAHIGVIQAIEEAGIRIDYIAGTSMGSMIGGLYAIGYTSEQLENIALSSNFTELFTEKANRRYISNYERGFDERAILAFPMNERRIDLPVGIITGQNVFTFLSRLTWNIHGTDDFNDFSIPFATVATDLETGKARVFRSGYLPDAIRASISIPSAFSPHEIDGKLYIDGGIARNLPVEDAIEMGANYTIAVDASSPLMVQDSLRSLTSILTQTVNFRINENAVEQHELADLSIMMDELRSYSASDFNRAEEILNIGKKAGREYAEAFRQIAARQTIPPPPREGVGELQSRAIDQVVIEGNQLFDNDFILRKLEFTPGAELTPDVIEEKVTQLYSSQFIEKVTYRVIPGEDNGSALHIRITENVTNLFKVGLRYETDTQASIYLESQFMNLLKNGSITRLYSRLGDQVNIGADYIYYGALGARLAFLASIQFIAEDIDWFHQGDRVSRFTNRIVRGEFSAGNYLNTQNLFSAGIRKDFLSHADVINPAGIEPTSRDYHALFFRYIFDSINRKSYPTAGQKIIAEGFYSAPVILSPVSFSAASLYWEGFYEITNDFSFRNSLYVGYTVGEDLPRNYWHTPNRLHPEYGYIPFGGYERYELSARNIQMASLGIQMEPFYHRFIALDVQTGRFLDQWNLDPDENEIKLGVSLTVGALTIMGPVQAVFSVSEKHPFLTKLQVGFQF